MQYATDEGGSGSTAQKMANGQGKNAWLASACGVPGIPSMRDRATAIMTFTYNYYQDLPGNY